MLSKMIPGATRLNVGKSQGFNGIAILDRTIEIVMSGVKQRVNEMVTFWEPTPAEIEDLIRGAPIQLGVIGQVFPPVMVQVGMLQGKDQLSLMQVAEMNVYQALVNLGNACDKDNTDSLYAAKLAERVDLAIMVLKGEADAIPAEVDDDED